MALTISVVIPVHNAAEHLRRCLEALSRSGTQPGECIVIDDGCTDRSAAVAREFGALVIRSEQRGPASARNLGATAATGDILFFIDADVCVHQDTITRILANLEDDPALDAVIGCYDESPESQGLVAQYRNLRQCFVHQRARRRAFTFWTGCGAIRRNVFLAFGGFDERYTRPSIEDIELGCRLSEVKRKIVLDSSVVVKHLKHWTLRSLLATDILDRGIPWTELILKHRSMPNDLNLQVRERIGVLLAFLLCALTILGTVGYSGFAPVPLLALPAVAMAVYRRPRPGKAICPAHVAYLFSALVLFLLLPASAVFAAMYLALFALILADRDFYAFVEARIGTAGALAAIPLHLLYHFYSGVSFAAGLGRFAWCSVAAAVRQVPALSGSPFVRGVRSPGQGGRDVL